MTWDDKNEGTFAVDATALAVVFDVRRQLLDGHLIDRSRLAQALDQVIAGTRMLDEMPLALIKQDLALERGLR